jgi:L-malate glycosyltransferase
MQSDVRNPLQKHLRVMHVILTLGVGGAEQLVYRMATRRSNENHTVVCCLLFVGELGEKLQKEGGKVYCRNHKGGIDFRIISWLKRIIVEEEIKVVHAHTYTPLFYSVPAAKLAGGVKVVYTEHGRLYPEQSDWKRSLINPLLAFGTSHIVAISESTAKAMSKYDKLPLKRIKVVHNGIGLPDIKKQVDVYAKRLSLGLSESCPVIGTAARIEDIKNIPMMLRAFRSVSNEIPEACLLIAGTGSKVRELKEYTEDLGVSQKVKFIGLRDDLWEVYQIMDIFLLTSFTEGISVTLLEAMASGVPAVVTNVGGNSEIVVDGVTGTLVPLNDDEAMAKGIIELLRDGHKRSNYAVNSRKRVMSCFAFDEMMRSYETLYNS